MLLLCKYRELPEEKIGLKQKLKHWQCLQFPAETEVRGKGETPGWSVSHPVEAWRTAAEIYPLTVADGPGRTRVAFLYHIVKKEGSV